ncbi:MAG: GIY-YIG nuclease family protein [Kovacikia sp.]
MNATEIVNYLAFSDFEQAIEVTREFNSLPKRPGVYAVRHRVRGVLYIGKTNNLASRFNGGHKAFLWAWLDVYPPADVKIIFYTLDRWGNSVLLSEVEAVLLRATEPPYNAQIPME